MQLRIGTRKSPLALAQAEIVRSLLLSQDPALSPDDVQLVPMVTSGDKGVTSDASQWGLKGLFTKELEDALLGGTIDMAVHSMKDMPSVLQEGLGIAAILEREDVRDAFISPHVSHFDALPHGSIVGTSSTRRAAQVRLLRPDLRIVGFRGNVGTRLSKLEQGEAYATFLAVAGLNRLGLSGHITEIMPVGRMLPAVSQAAIGIECRHDNGAVLERVARLNHAPTACCVHTERALMLALDGSCRSPIAAHAIIDGHYIRLNAQIMATDGSEQESGTIMAPVADGEHIGRELGMALKHQASRLLA